MCSSDLVVLWKAGMIRKWFRATPYRWSSPFTTKRTNLSHLYSTSNLHPLKSNSLLNDPGSSIFCCQSDHDSTLFEANGITLKPAKKFHHDFNVQHIARIEAKQLKVSGELENLEKKEGDL